MAGESRDVPRGYDARYYPPENADQGTPAAREGAEDETSSRPSAPAQNSRRVVLRGRGVPAIDAEVAEPIVEEPVVGRPSSDRPVGPPLQHFGVDSGSGDFSATVRRALDWLPLQTDRQTAWDIRIVIEDVQMRYETRCISVALSSTAGEAGGARVRYNRVVDIPQEVVEDSPEQTRRYLSSAIIDLLAAGVLERIATAAVAGVSTAFPRRGRPRDY